MRPVLLVALILAGAAQAQAPGQVHAQALAQVQAQVPGLAPSRAEQESAAARAAEQLAAMAQTPEEPSVLPDGPGRDEMFYGCVACHDTAVIRRSRLSRPQWDDLMDWMVERHGMAPLEGDDRKLIVDYLAQHFGPAQAPARGRNPFLN